MRHMLFTKSLKIWQLATLAMLMKAFLQCCNIPQSLGRSEQEESSNISHFSRPICERFHQTKTHNTREFSTTGHLDNDGQNAGVYRL